MSQDVLQTIFTVLGILYSVLLSSIVSFTYDDVLNLRYRKRISKKLRVITIKSSVFFGISTIVFIIHQANMCFLFTDNCVVLGIIFIILGYCAIYYVLTFITLQQLRIEISDEVLEEKKQLGQV